MKPTAGHGSIPKDATKRGNRRLLKIEFTRTINTVVGLSHRQALTPVQPCAHSALMLSWLALFVVEHTETMHC